MPATLSIIHGGHLQEVVPVTDLRAALQAPPGSQVWVDVERPTAGDLAALREFFGISELLMQDLRRGKQRPRFSDFGNFHYLVMYSASWEAVRRPRLAVHELSFLLTETVAVTLHDHPIPEMAAVRVRWAHLPPNPRRHDVAFLAYALCDEITNAYFAVLDGIEDEVDDLEEAVFTGSLRSNLPEIFQLRRELLELRKIVSPERDVFSVLARQDSGLNRTMRLYVMDVYDHLLRVTDMIDTYRDVVSGVLDGYISVQGNNLNTIMKILTAASIILMAVALVPAVYGMNFENMPELGWTFGYLWALGLMLAIGLILGAWFRARGWI